MHAHLERAGILAWVVNAHFIKHVPGRKTDMADSEWLAVLARFGLVRASFIPPQDLRELRLVSRYRRKLTAMCASEINRLHKILDDAGIKLELGAVVSDSHGVSARAMAKGLIEGRDAAALLGLARGALKLKELALSLEGDLSARHLFVLGYIHAHIEALQAELAEIDAYLIAAIAPYAWAHGLLQTIPGIDQIAAALILIAARMTKSTLAAKYRSLMVRKSHKKAIVAIAHKMIRLIYLLLTRKEPYLDQRIDYAAMSAARNAPRWIKQLKAIGKWPAAPLKTAAAH
ncbi:MAG: transposase [Rhodoferax sp.]|nr:transposase [Rhodoferax sp.]